MRIRFRSLGILLTTFFTLTACSGASHVPSGSGGVMAALSALSDDSMAGRAAGSPGAWMAARFIAERLETAGVEPAGDSGYFQWVAMRSRGAGRFALLPDLGALDTVPAGQGVRDANVVGVVPGGDRAEEVVVVGAHYDHVGIGRPVAGDSIYNGADDDASGVVAVLEAARAIATGSPPSRTVVFLFSTAEEGGLVGTRWYIAHPVRPLERTVADLQVEMVGRPDGMAGGPGRVWLTGDERSTMGALLRAADLAVVPDPRPAQDFFRRSDNYPFAEWGIPAHTLSSFGMHGDYHRPSDEVEAVDAGHLSAVVALVIAAVRTLADGDRPEWRPGGRPRSP